MPWEEFALGPTKLLRVRVFSRHASVRSRPRVDFIPNSYLAFRRFSVKHGYFYFLSRKKSRFTKQFCFIKPKCEQKSVCLKQRSRAVFCKVSALSHTSLLCAATFTPLLQQLLRFVSAWSFGIFDIFRIFPAAALLIQSLLCLTGSPSLLSSTACVVITMTF